MIGGGSWTAFLPGAPFDPELFVRSAQVHALCPMMQFSASPWRVLDAEKQKIVRDIVALRQKFSGKIVELARASGHTGEPMLRNLEYNFPGMGYAGISDQFMMGEDLLVAPVVEKGAVSRKVVLPPGKWKADDGQVHAGPATIEVSTPLSRLPHFIRL
jgi:alpha-glucosidase